MFTVGRHEPRPPALAEPAPPRRLPQPPGRPYSVKGDDKATISVGAAQRSVKVGMTNAAVAEALGSPNILSTDEEGREVWIYDRVTSSVRATAANGPLTLFVGGSAAAAERSQSTLTIIVKFDKAGKVRDLAYHTSKF
jgi:outer membrane protein assembly factor BamE (lipoprotein component of BamABCDE complex)